MDADASPQKPTAAGFAIFQAIAKVMAAGARAPKVKEGLRTGSSLAERVCFTTTIGTESNNVSGNQQKDNGDEFNPSLPFRRARASAAGGRCMGEGL
jgi:hypothetical protein